MKLRLFSLMLIASSVAISAKSQKKARVLSGLDVLMQKPDAKLKGKRLALIVNHSAVNGKGKHIIDVLHPRFTIAKIFAPEHGVRGAEDEFLSGEKDAQTGLPVISLYQKNKKAPSVEDLADVDLLIFDIQEIGLRYYTYATTMVLAMKAAKAANKKILILDRPNMAAALGVYGPKLEEKFHGGFAGYYPIPIAHAMTIGELALLYNKEFGIDADVEVVKLSGYKHKMFYDETKLPWRNPSPSIVNMQSVLGYHLIGSLEALNISVGRGTKAPFQLYGAPFINAQKIVKALTQAKLPGLRFEAAKFTPTRSAYAKKQIMGFKLTITNRHILQPMRTLVTIAKAIRQQLPDEGFAQNWERIGNGIGNLEYIAAIAKGEKNSTLLKRAEVDAKTFNALRQKYLLYK